MLWLERVVERITLGSGEFIRYFLSVSQKNPVCSPFNFWIIRNTIIQKNIWHLAIWQNWCFGQFIDQKKKSKHLVCQVFCGFCLLIKQILLPTSLHHIFLVCTMDFNSRWDPFLWDRFNLIKNLKINLHPILAHQNTTLNYHLWLKMSTKVFVTPTTRVCYTWWRRQLKTELVFVSQNKVVPKYVHTYTT